jgi:site-specific recombinase XerD
MCPGCRPLKDQEKTQVPGAFDGRFELRDRLLFLLMRYTTFRISEALSIAVRQVYDGTDMAREVHLPPHATKGKKHGKTKPLNPKLRPHLLAWINVMRAEGWYAPDAALFYSPATGKAITRLTAHRHFKAVYRKLKLPGVEIRGRLATHVPRKTVASEVYQRTKDIMAIKKLLDHQSVLSSQAYLDFPNDELESILMDL